MTQTKLYLETLNNSNWQYPVTSITTTIPSSPSEGTRHIVGTSATGTWSGYTNYITTYFNSSWIFDNPGSGTQIYITTSSGWYYYNGSNWYLEGTQPFISNPSIYEDGSSYYNTTDNTLYIYDSNRTKWLSAKRSVLDFSGRATISGGVYLNAYGVFTSNTQTYRIPYNITIVGYVVSTTTAVNSSVTIYKTGGTNILTCNYTNGSTYFNITNSNIDVSSGDIVYAQVTTGSGAITNPIVELVYCRKG